MSALLCNILITAIFGKGCCEIVPENAAVSCCTLAPLQMLSDQCRRQQHTSHHSIQECQKRSHKEEETPCVWGCNMWERAELWAWHRQSCSAAKQEWQLLPNQCQRRALGAGVGYARRDGSASKPWAASLAAAAIGAQQDSVQCQTLTHMVG